MRAVSIVCTFLANWGVPLAVLLFACSLIGVYWHTFHTPGAPFDLSLGKGDWGTFGDYVGGVLNPALSFLAFITVLKTVKMQAEDLRLARLQAEQQPIHSLMAALNERIDRQFASEPQLGKSQLVLGPFQSTTLFEHLQVWRGFERHRRAFPKAAGDFGVEHLRADLQRPLRSVALLLVQVARGLELLREGGASPSVIEFYQGHYLPYAGMLNEVGLWEEVPHVARRIFPVESLPEQPLE